MDDWPMLAVFLVASAAAEPRRRAAATADHEFGTWSQGEQDRRLMRIFRTLGLQHRGSFVEFGYFARQGSNTENLERRGWDGFRMDGWNNDKSAKCHRVGWISSKNIVELFRRFSAPVNVTYVSIDLDSSDLWIMKALLSAEFRPAVISIEYNSNFPYGYPLAFPDVLNTMPTRYVGWDKGCYMASSAHAIEVAAREFGYVVVDIEPGYDLFLVRAELWGKRPVPDLAASRMLYRPFNIGFWLNGQKGKDYPKHTAMHPNRQAQYLDYSVYQETGSLVAARRQAAGYFERFRKDRLPCFMNTTCAVETLVLCKHLNSYLCPTSAGTDPCAPYPPSSSEFPLKPFPASTR